MVRPGRPAEGGKEPKRGKMKRRHPWFKKQRIRSFAGLQLEEWIQRQRPQPAWERLYYLGEGHGGIAGNGVGGGWGGLGGGYRERKKERIKRINRVRHVVCCCSFGRCAVRS